MKTAFFYVPFSVDLSRRKAVLLRGGPLWKGLGGIITYTSTPLHRLSFGPLERPPSFLVYAKCRVAELGHAVLLFLRVVVSQALAAVPASGVVVPQVPTVVPHPWSGSTVRSGQA